MDGSISADIPMNKVAEFFNVNCFLVSQVNPLYNKISPNSIVSCAVPNFYEDLRIKKEYEEKNDHLPNGKEVYEDEIKDILRKNVIDLLEPDQILVTENALKHICEVYSE